jgi:hypothetical protein
LDLELRFLSLSLLLRLEDSRFSRLQRSWLEAAALEAAASANIFDAANISSLLKGFPGFSEEPKSENVSY